MSRVAFLFPGQGAQRAGMGKDFYEVSAVARKVIDEAGEWLGLDLKKLCFEEDERLNQTEYTPGCASDCLPCQGKNTGNLRHFSGGDGGLKPGRILCHRDGPEPFP